MVERLELLPQLFVLLIFLVLAIDVKRFQQFYYPNYTDMKTINQSLIFYMDVFRLLNTLLVCLIPKFFCMVCIQLKLFHKMGLNDAHTLKTFRYPLPLPLK